MPYTASQATNFFKYTLLVALVLSTGVIGLFIAEVNVSSNFYSTTYCKKKTKNESLIKLLKLFSLQPSTSCGPFRGEGGSNEIVFNYITRKVKELDNLDGLKQVLFHLFF